MRLAISNLLSNPPTVEKRPALVISCKDDGAFAAFLKHVLEEPVTQ